MELYDRIKWLCKQHRISIYKLCKDIGIRSSVLSDLKTGRKTGLSIKTSSKIADYFSVTLDQLFGAEKIYGLDLPEESSSNDPESELAEYLEYLKDRSELRMLFSVSKNATKKDVMRAVAIIEVLKKEADGPDV